MSIEILKAKRGDSFILRHGTGDDALVVVIDGGWKGVYRSALRPALLRIRQEVAPGETMSLDLVVVSHVDEDHIAGILDLTAELTEAAEAGIGEPDFSITRLWHNTFQAVAADPGVAGHIQPARQVVTAAVSGDGSIPAGISRSNALVLLSVGQGNQLLADAALLGAAVNPPLGPLLHVPNPTVPVEATLGTGLTFRLLGPTLAQLEAFRDHWEEKTGEEAGPITPASFSDDSITNIASVVLLVSDEDANTLLLTGDARGDFICEAIDAAGFADPLTVDVLKLPHHGSSNNVTQRFFERIVADHYVIGGDGSHGNPNIEAFQMIIAARSGDADRFTIHLSHDPVDYQKHHGVPYDSARLNQVLDDGGRGTRFDLRTPGPGDASSLMLNVG